MRVLVSIAVLVSLAGCSPSKGLEAQNPSPPAAGPDSSKTSSATATASTALGSTALGSTARGSTGAASTGTATSTTQSASAKGTPVASETTKPIEVDPSDNPNRVYQLRFLKHATLKVNGKSIDAWVMDNDLKRQEGMMFLTDKDVKEDQGMIFVFGTPQQNDAGHGFWMHNTILPLDIVYIAQNHHVLNVQKGKPQDDKNLPAAATYQFVLELKQGEAAKLGIKPETVIEIPGDVRESS